MDGVCSRESLSGTKRFQNVEGLLVDLARDSLWWNLLTVRGGRCLAGFGDFEVPWETLKT